MSLFKPLYQKAARNRDMLRDAVARELRSSEHVLRPCPHAGRGCVGQLIIRKKKASAGGGGYYLACSSGGGGAQNNNNSVDESRGCGLTIWLPADASVTKLVDGTPPCHGCGQPRLRFSFRHVALEPHLRMGDYSACCPCSHPGAPSITIIT